MKKQIMFILCAILFVSFPVACSFMGPGVTYPNKQREVEELNKQAGFAYIDESNPNLSEIGYLELLDSQHYDAKTDGRYEMYFKYLYENCYYNITIRVEKLDEFLDNNDCAVQDFTETHEGYHFYSKNNESSVAYFEELFCIIGNYVYEIDSCFETEGLNQVERNEKIEINRDIAKQFMDELINDYNKKLK